MNTFKMILRFETSIDLKISTSSDLSRLRKIEFYLFLFLLLLYLTTFLTATVDIQEMYRYT